MTNVNEITYQDVADYLRISELDDIEIKNLKTYLNVAKKYIKDETGLTDDEIKKHEDFVIVVLVLCQDMYDNRTFYVDKSNVNKVVDTILGRHRTNLL